jgi:hypothetical protein
VVLHETIASISTTSASKAVQLAGEAGNKGVAASLEDFREHGLDGW